MIKCFAQNYTEKKKQIQKIQSSKALRYSSLGSQIILQAQGSDGSTAGPKRKKILWGCWKKLCSSNKSPCSFWSNLISDSGITWEVGLLNLKFYIKMGLMSSHLKLGVSAAQSAPELRMLSLTPWELSVLLPVLLPVSVHISGVILPE